MATEHDVERLREELHATQEEVRSTRENVLLIHKDLQQMSTAIKEMASSMKILADVQVNLRLIEDRCEARNNERKNDMLFVRSEIQDIKPRAYEGRVAYNVIKWVGITVGSLAIGSMFGAWIWAIAQQGVK